MNATLVLTAGRKVTLRPFVPGDAGALQAFVTEALSPASRQNRFHGAVNGLAPGVLRHLTEADGVQHVAWAAWLQDGSTETLVGEARYFVDQDGDAAELAISVADALRGRGVAELLLAALCESAAKTGVRWLYGYVLGANDRMTAFMRRRGFLACANAAGAGEGIARFERRAAPLAQPARSGTAQRLRQWLRASVFGLTSNASRA